MCVDFTIFNKACPKASFPLTIIDNLIDASSEQRVLNFMNAFSRYNQILVNSNYQEKI